MKYTFLFKPLFFIFNLLFASWMVFKIEQISPSDFGVQEPLPKEKNLSSQIQISSLPELKKLCFEYKAGLLDSAEFERKLNKLLLLPKSNGGK